MKFMLNLLTIGAIVLNFSGCTPGQNVEVSQLSTNSAKSFEKEMSYKDTISKKDVTVDEFRNNIIPSFNYKMRYIELEYKNSFDFSKSCDIVGDICKIYGRTAKLDNNSIDLYFLNGLGHNVTTPEKNAKIFDINNKDVYRSVAKFHIPFQYEFKNNKFYVKGSYPNTFDNYVAGRFGFNNFLAFAPESDMNTDAFKSFSNLENIQIRRNFELEGEVNSKFDNKSIEGNFDRTLPDFDTVKIVYVDFVKQLTQKEFIYLSRTNPRVIQYKNQLFPISYKIFPYQNGTKVVYKIDVNYKLNADGTATITDKDLEGLKKEVEHLVND